MGCFHCICCCKLSKDSSTQLRRREGTTGCLCCKGTEKRNDRKREGYVIGCLCCGRPSSSKNDSPKKSERYFFCKKSSKKDKDSKSEGKCKKCFTRFKTSKEEKNERKRRGSGIGYLCCSNSSSKDDLLESKGCCCFPCKKSSRDAESKGEGADKKCFSCFRSSKERKESMKRDYGIRCLCCKALSSSNNDLTERRGCCYFSSKKSLKKDMNSRSEENDKNCYSCFRSSKEEGKEKKQRVCGIGHFCCSDSSLKDELSKARVCCCLYPKNSSKGGSKSREGKDKRCFSCFRSSKEVSSNKGKRGTWCCDNKLSKEHSSKKEEKTSCSYCFSCCVGKSLKENSSKNGGGFCFQCCSGKSLKVSDHEETVNEKKKLNVNFAKKRSKVTCCCGFCCTRSLDERKQTSETKCTLSCFYCVQSKSYQNSTFSKRKKTLSHWQIKEPSHVGNHLTIMEHTLSLKSDNDATDLSQAILPLASCNSSVQVFAFKELAAATKNFSEDCLIGSGGFGRVYKGELLGENEIVAINQLKKNVNQGSNEFLVDVVMVSLLHHPNLVKLLGYCAEEDQLIIVYEYMPFGSLQDHLLDIVPNNVPLDWFTRMKIAAGTANGLQHLHDVANPPIIYRDMKASNILLDVNCNPKLSDFGLEKPTRVMGAYGCYAPEYAFTRQLTKTTDVYSFGVLLLELITGRKAIDITRPKNGQYFSHWAAPFFKDKRKYTRMADPLLNGNYPIKGLYQALAIANMCLQYEASSRPLMSDIVTAIEYLVNPETDCSEPLEEPSIPNQLITSNHEKLKFQPMPGNSGMRTNTMSLDDESFQSLSSDIESCGILREEDEHVEA